MAPDRPLLLVLGGSGQVGWELRRSLAPLGEVVGTTLEGGAGPGLDLTRPGELAGVLDALRPTLVVNAAAHTAVDRAEQEPAVAAAVNADAVAELGRVAARWGTPVIHYSTDFVFDGRSPRPYREDDPPAPLGVYGETKLAGERALAESGAPHLVLRTSWVYGIRGGNFLLTMLRLFREREEVRVVDDQTGTPTWSRMIAEATAQIAAGLVSGRTPIADVQGTYHLTCGGSATWHGFARAILERAGTGCRLVPIPTRDYPTPARRPAYSVLDNAKLHRTFGLALPDWRVALSLCLDDLGL
jgi:dTDP-4-dehydrorhamnose reductase